MRLFVKAHEVEKSLNILARKLTQSNVRVGGRRVTYEKPGRADFLSRQLEPRQRWKAFIGEATRHLIRKR